MIDFSQISKEVFDNLLAKKVDITPLSFQDEFCKLIHVYGLEHPDCEKFHHLMKELTTYKPNDFSMIEIKNIYQLSEKLFEVLKQDQEALSKSTQDITKLVSIINHHIIDLIASNTNEVTKVVEIKNEIEKIDLDEDIKGDMFSLKNRLVDAACSIESHMNSVNDTLQQSGQEVEKLKEKINTLESELDIAKHDSTFDYLTGVLLRGAYEQEIKVFEDEFVNEQKDYAVIFIDIDHFKKVNDRYGHDAGDFILKIFGQILQKLTRKTDVVGRYGGEEFIVGFRFNKNEEILYYLKRLKDVIKSKQFTYNDAKISLTFCAGVSVRSSNISYEETIKEADNNVYKAKTGGRDKIILPIFPGVM